MSIAILIPISIPSSSVRGPPPLCQIFYQIIFSLVVDD